MKEIILVGNGKLAEAIVKGFSRYSDIPLIKYSTELQPDRQSIFVHVGSGREYQESLALAISCDSAYIQAATEKDIPLRTPTAHNIRFVHSPNLDMHIIKLFYCLKQVGSLFDGEDISIMESHQQEKRSQAGTALKFCDYLKIPHERIESIRDPEEQKKLPLSNLGHHAYHRIHMGEADSSITIETCIEGAESYVRGLARIVEAVAGLDEGHYEIDDLLELGLL